MVIQSAAVRPQAGPASEELDRRDSSSFIGPVEDLKEVRIDDDNNDNDDDDDDSTTAAAEEQLLQKSRAVNIAAKLGRHLLQFHRCEPHAHRRACEHHF